MNGCELNTKHIKKKEMEVQQKEYIVTVSDFSEIKTTIVMARVYLWWLYYLLHTTKGLAWGSTLLYEWKIYFHGSEVSSSVRRIFILF